MALERIPVLLDPLTAPETGAEDGADITLVETFRLIAHAVRTSEKYGYGVESMASDLVARIVERYLADHREVFAVSNRLDDLMDCLDVFVRAGWPNAQALTFRLGEIWR
jgi:hypothetical protein